MMELYGAARSSASFRVRIALAYKGLAYEASFVSLSKGEHRTPQYRRVNKQGLVPALIDNDRLMIQSLAIIEYLEERYPAPPLLPETAPDRAYVRAISQMIACEMQPLNNLRTLSFIRNAYALDDAGVRVWYHHWIADGFAMLERYLSSENLAGSFCFGDMVTVADCCLVPQVFNARRYDCDLSAFPIVLSIFDACMALPAFEGAQASVQPDFVG
jgi:maleylacetoacetate isomerase